MGLRIRLKPHEKIIINGCVVENGDRRNTLTVSSFGQVLKSRDILQLDDVRTPIQKLYYEIQMLLIEAARDYSRVTQVNAAAAELLKSGGEDVPTPAVMRAMDFVHTEDPYRALSELRDFVFPARNRDQEAA